MWFVSTFVSVTILCTVNNKINLKVVCKIVRHSDLERLLLYRDCEVSVIAEMSSS